METPIVFGPAALDEPDVVLLELWLPLLPEHPAASIKTPAIAANFHTKAFTRLSPFFTARTAIRTTAAAEK